jgi:hypothetical protein
MSGQKWYSCNLCGTQYDEVEIVFASGSVVPAEGEILTGATSGATAVALDWQLVSGSWSGGTAAGIIWAELPSGFDFDTGHWGSEDEAITGSLATTFTMVGYGNKKSYGRLYPEDEVIDRDGATLCLFHSKARYNFRDKNEQEIEISEETDE